MTVASIQRYRASQVRNNDAPGVMLMLFEGAERFLRRSRQGFLENNRQMALESASRARAIVDELNLALDRKQAPEICDALSRIYDFASDRITQSIITLDVTFIEEAIAGLEPIIEGFREAVPKARAELSKKVAP